MHVIVGVDGLGRVPVLDEDAALSLLDEHERDRWARLAHPADRDSFAIAHATLRWIVGERLGRDPRDVTIDVTDTGRPVVRDSSVHVSLARRRGAVAVAVHDSPVGIDVELCPPDVDVRAVAQRFFPPVEADAVTVGGDPARVFCRLWVRKEAVAKALDLSLDAALALPVGEAVMVAPATSSDPARSVLLRDLAAPPGIVAASAVVVSG